MNLLHKLTVIPVLVARPWCWLTGHEDVVTVIDYAAGRMFGRCPRCLWESPGWELPKPRGQRQTDAAPVADRAMVRRPAAAI